MWRIIVLVLAAILIGSGTAMSIWCMCIPPLSEEEQREEDERQLKFLRDRKKKSNCPKEGRRKVQ